MWQLEPLLSSQPWKQKQKTQINVTSELWNKAQFWNPKKIGDRQINLNSNWWLVYRQLIFMSVHLDLSRIILSEKKGKRVDTCVLSVTVCLRSNILLRLQSKDHEEIQNECRVDVLRLWGGGGYHLFLLFLILIELQFSVYYISHFNSWALFYSSFFSSKKIRQKKIDKLKVNRNSRELSLFFLKGGKTRHLFFQL